MACSSLVTEAVARKQTMMSDTPHIVSANVVAFPSFRLRSLRLNTRISMKDLRNSFHRELLQSPFIRTFSLPAGTPAETFPSKLLRLHVNTRASHTGSASPCPPTGLLSKPLSNEYAKLVTLDSQQNVLFVTPPVSSTSSEPARVIRNY